MKKILLFLVFSFLFTLLTRAQDAEPVFEEEKEEESIEKPAKKKRKLNEKLSFGGGFDFSFGTYTVLSLSPILAYRAHERVLLGFEVRSAYVSDSYNQIKSFYYGGGPFGRIVLFKGIYFQAQAEFINYDNELFNATRPGRRWNSAIMFGGGYRQQIGERSYSYVSILWDINETSNTFFTNPIVRFGIMF